MASSRQDPEVGNSFTQVRTELELTKKLFLKVRPKNSDRNIDED